MWESSCKRNPWLLFRRAASNQRKHEGEDQLPPKEAECASEQNWQAAASKRIPDDRNILHYHNGNGNAHMKMASEPEAIEAVDSDQSAQAELMDNVMEMNDQFSRPSMQKVGNSRSLGTLNRKLIVKPRGCRSLEVCSKHDDIFMEYNTSPECKNMENFYGLEQVQKAEALGQVQRACEDEDEWECFQINLGKSGPENKSNNEKASVNTNSEQGTNSINIPKREVSLERMVSPKQNHQNGSKEHENQWSPFRVVGNRSKSRLFSEYRHQEQDSPVSSESCCSIDSGEAGYPDVILDIADSDSTEEPYNGHDRVVDSDTKEESNDEHQSDDENYEVIEWSKYTTGYIELENGMSIRDVCDTSSESPKLDLSALEGYHTAPNSPDKRDEEYGEAEKTEDTVINLRPFQNQINGNSTQHAKEKTQIRHMYERPINTNLLQKTGTDPNTKDRVCNKCESSSALERFPNEVASALDDTVYDFGKRDENCNFQRINGRISTMNYRKLALEDPPFISVESIHYEADPTTGNCRVVGRGSFGKVYKARFSDPMYLHLPIVVKEFDEEFTNAKEILEEAKRLLYLQDTGYVPVCYGVLCFGSPQYQKYGIVQEYVGTGLTLEQMLWDETELPIEYWFRIAIQSCEGLARFHEKGILLNDIKTNNILLEFGNNTVRIRYIDFGLATDLRGKRYKNTKSLEEFTYLAPEVRIGGQVTNLASDIYSLGYMLEQIYTHTSARDFAVVARLCMDVDPDTRLPVRRAASLLRERFGRFGFDPRSCDIV